MSSDRASAVATADALDGEAMILQARACMLRITAELTPVFSERLTDAVCAEVARENAEAACEPPAEVCRRLTAELAELDTLARLADAAMRSPVVSERVKGVERAAACEAVRADLTGRLGEAQAEVTAARHALRLAELRVSHAYATATAALDGLTSPLTSPVGQATQAYSAWLADSGMWRNDPRSSTARELVREYLGPSGVGAEVQREAIAAYLAGDPAARAVGGTDRLESGSEVTHSPDRPYAIVAPHRLSGHEAADAALPVPQVPGDARARAQSAARGLIS